MSDDVKSEEQASPETVTSVDRSQLAFPCHAIAVMDLPIDPFGAPAMRRAAAASIAFLAARVAAGVEDDAIVVDGGHLHKAAALMRFGERHDWPPEEAFARESAAISSDRFDPEAFAVRRPAWAAFRAVGKVLSGMKAFEAEPEAQGAVPARPSRDPDDDAFETFDDFEARETGAAPRQRLEGFEGGAVAPAPAPPALPPSTTMLVLNGIGQATESALHTLGVTSLEQFAALDEEAINVLREKSPPFVRRLIDEGGQAQARAYLAQKAATAP